jgi:hypothetical protein
MRWELIDPRTDVEAVVEMADGLYGPESEGIVQKDRNVFRHHLTVCATNQLFDKNKEFIAGCWDADGKLMGYCWFDRGGYTSYSRDEISNAKFHHVDLALPVRTRYKLLNAMIDQHILWANQCGVPVICSSSIRAEQDGFLKIHAKRGFKINGSYAWGRTLELLEKMNAS